MNDIPTTIELTLLTFVRHFPFPTSGASLVAIGGGSVGAVPFEALKHQAGLVLDTAESAFKGSVMDGEMAECRWQQASFELCLMYRLTL